MKAVGTLGLVLAVAAFACGGSSEEGGTTVSAGGSGAGGAAGTAAGGTAGALSWQECFGDDGQRVKWALDLCTGDSCTIVEHQLDCCGNLMLVGVTQAKLSAFEQCEAEWRDTLPACDCPVGPLQLEQGGSVTSVDEASVGCVNWSTQSGICQTFAK